MISRNTIVLVALAFLSPAVASEMDIPIPDSRWIELDQAMALQAIGEAEFDLLILPVQGGENSFDPIGRSLITHLIADRLMTGADLRIPNPTYVFRALGSNRSTYPPEAIESLITSLEPKQVLELHANHDRSGHFDLVVSVLDGSSRAAQRSRTWSELTYENTRLPSMAVQDILAEIFEFVTNEEAPGLTKTPAASLTDFRFTGSLEELIAESGKSPLHSAAYLQLVGMLHPNRDFNEARYGLFERSLVELQRLPDDAPGKRLFVARAYAYLGRRPAAVATLGEPRTSHERALLAVLNGDLPGLRNEVEAMGTSPLDFMAWRELAWLESEYGDEKERPIIDSFVEMAPTWAPFIDRALRDTSHRPEFTTAMAKVGLEQLIPNDVVSLEQLLAIRSVVTREMPGELELTRLVWRHADAVDAKEIGSRIANPKTYLSVSELDIVDLGKAVAVANQFLRVEFELAIRQLPDDALSKISDFNVIFAGHPAFALQKARALEELSRKATGDERWTLMNQYAAEYLNGLAWTGQMTRDAAQAARRYDASIRQLGLGKYSTPGKPVPIAREDPIRYFEWPMSPAWYYVYASDPLAEDVVQPCIDYTWTWFSCLKVRVEKLDEGSTKPTEAGKDLMAAHAHRFIGSPQRDEFEFQLMRRSGDADDVIPGLREKVEAGSTDWGIYYALGRALNRNGDHQAAQEAFLSYPGFADPALSDAITLSHYAGDAGSMLYWIGRYEEAVPLLEIAAGSGTGSESSMSAANRLSLIFGDLEAAQDFAAARLSRYDSDYALRDLLQILYVRGESDIAWRLFDHAMQSPRRKAAQWWSGALIGHRLASASTEDIANWIDASELRQSAFIRTATDQANVKLAPRYLLLNGTMDRLPGPELAEAMARFRFERPTRYVRSDRWPRSGPEGTTVVPGYVQEDGKRLGFDELISTPPGLPDKERFEPVEPRYEAMARAMSALLGKDHEGAFEIFNEAARLYHLDEYLPYYAFSASVLGRAGHLHAALQAREPMLEDIRREESNTSSQRGYRFDEDLTYAVLAAFDGHHDESIRYLEQAMNNRPYLDYRTIFPYYEVVDLADRLFDRTGIPAYRDYALDMARRHTVILPMYSWAYFIVAKFSESEAERIEATASGLKLDPLSYRATQLPEALVDKARLHLQEHGAPYLRRTEEDLNVET